MYHITIKKGVSVETIATEDFCSAQKLYQRERERLISYLKGNERVPAQVSICYDGAQVEMVFNGSEEFIQQLG